MPNDPPPDRPASSTGICPSATPTTTTGMCSPTRRRTTGKAPTNSPTPIPPPPGPPPGTPFCSPRGALRSSSRRSVTRSASTTPGSLGTGKSGEPAASHISRPMSRTRTEWVSTDGEGPPRCRRIGRRCQRQTSGGFQQHPQARGNPCAAPPSGSARPGSCRAGSIARPPRAPRRVARGVHLTTSHGRSGAAARTARRAATTDPAAATWLS